LRERQHILILNLLFHHILDLAPEQLVLQEHLADGLAHFIYDIDFLGYCAFCAGLLDGNRNDCTCEAYRLGDLITAEVNLLAFLQVDELETEILLVSMHKREHEGLFPGEELGVVDCFGPPFLPPELESAVHSVQSFGGFADLSSPESDN
jgi:hypothetical protein